MFLLPDFLGAAGGLLAASREEPIGEAERQRDRAARERLLARLAGLPDAGAANAASDDRIAA